MSLNTVISFPIPAYQNVPIEPQFFKPRQFFISNIVLGATTTVTTTVSNDYVLGQQIRLIIPNGFGCRELNEKTGYILSIDAPDEFTLDIYSSGITPFTTNPSLTTQPQTLAIGDINTGLISNTGRNLPFGQVPTTPGSFQNISP